MSNQRLSNPPDEIRDSVRPSKEPISMMLDRLRTLATRKDEMWWEIGCALDEIAVRGFYAALGFDDWLSFAEARVELSRDDALVLRKVSRYFSKETAVRFGLRKLNSLLTYLEMCPSCEPVVDLLRVRIVLRTNGEETLVPFSGITQEQLDEAIKDVAFCRRRGDIDVPSDVSLVRDEIAEAMRKSRLSQVNVKVHHHIGPEDTFSLVVGGVDPYNMKAVSCVLAEQADYAAAAARAEA